LSAKYRPDELKSEIEAIESQITKKKEVIDRLEAKQNKRKQQVDELKGTEASLQLLYKQLAEKQEKLTRLPYPAHKILADRIAKRDPGNAPASGERIGFVYIAPPSGQLAPKLQGDRIETPDFIREKGLRPDYKYYIEHQLEKPIGQLFGLVVEQIPGYNGTMKSMNETDRDILASMLLFKKALQECDKQGRRAFVAQQFGGQLQDKSQEENFGGNILITPSQERRSTRIQEKQAPQVQTTLNSYFVHKAILQQYEETKKKELSNLKQKDKDDKKKKK
jgi:DNA polymerase delta subunit 1